ncbi:5425_t:CDS:2 [Funneliformis mosseae]|uniref:5425_t:CDS:1 n=1 Tax=Funneliformis mosseae TaxID=27381 RepID=A0A9N9FU40_FUNMO|nr:5425_t:CDS:2 [Funneliformis mosseae]
MVIMVLVLLPLLASGGRFGGDTTAALVNFFANAYFPLDEDEEEHDGDQKNPFRLFQLLQYYKRHA